jgi:hypothetical protein
MQDGGDLPAGWETAVLPTTQAWEISPDVKAHSSINYFNTSYVLLTSSPALGQMNKSLYRTDDHGKSWTRVGDIASGISGYPTGISFRAANEGWITATYHGLFIAQFVKNGKKTYVPYESRDSGNTWLPIKYRLTDVQAPPVYHFDDLIIGRAISTDGKTIYTMDTYNKEEWHKIKPNIVLKGASQFFLRSDGYGWVLLNGHTKITHDGGITWTDPA